MKCFASLTSLAAQFQNAQFSPNAESYFFFPVTKPVSFFLFSSYSCNCDKECGR